MYHSLCKFILCSYFFFSNLSLVQFIWNRARNSIEVTYGDMHGGIRLCVIVIVQYAPRHGWNLRNGAENGGSKFAAQVLDGDGVVAEDVDGHILILEPEHAAVRAVHVAEVAIAKANTKNGGLQRRVVYSFAVGADRHRM